MSQGFAPEQKLELVLRSYRSRNVRAFCRRQGVDPATLYRWRRELARVALAAWSSRRPGRPSVRSRLTVETLEAELRQLLVCHQALQREARAWRLLASLAGQMLDPADPALRLLAGIRAH